MMKGGQRLLFKLIVSLVLLSGCGFNFAYKKEVPYGVWLSEEPYLMLDLDYRYLGGKYPGEYIKDGEVIDAIIRFNTDMTINIYDAIDISDYRNIDFVGNFTVNKDTLVFKLNSIFAERYGYEKITLKKTKSYEPPTEDETDYIELIPGPQRVDINEFMYEDFDAIVLDEPYSFLYNTAIVNNDVTTKFKLIEAGFPRDNSFVNLFFVVEGSYSDFLTAFTKADLNRESYMSHNGRVCPMNNKYAEIHYIQRYISPINSDDEFGTLTSYLGDPNVVYTLSRSYNDFYIIWVYFDLNISDDEELPELVWSYEANSQSQQLKSI